MRAIEQVYTTYVDILFQQNRFYDPIVWWISWNLNIVVVYYQVMRNYVRKYVRDWVLGRSGWLMIISAVVISVLTTLIALTFLVIMGFYVTYIALSVLLINIISALTIIFAESINSSWLTVLSPSYRYWNLDPHKEDLQVQLESSIQAEPIGNIIYRNAYLTVLEGTLSDDQHTKICLLGGAVIQTDTTSFIFGITTKNLFESLTTVGTYVNVCYEYKHKTVCRALRKLVRCKIDNQWSVEDVNRIAVLRDISLRGSVSRNGMFNDYIRHLSLLTEDILLVLVTFFLAKLPGLPNELSENSLTIALGMAAFRHLVMSGDPRMALTRPVSEVLLLWSSTSADLAHLALLIAKTFNTRIIDHQNSWAPLVHEYSTSNGVIAPVKKKSLAVLMGYVFVGRKIIDADGTERGRLNESFNCLDRASYKPDMF